MPGYRRSVTSASTDETLGGLALAAFERRGSVVAELAKSATTVANACRDMAKCFDAGGRLFVFGAGSAATDAEHIAVEFVHPVIVGKRALPALSLASDAAVLSGLAAERGPDEVFSHQIAVLGRPGDIALGLGVAGGRRAVTRGLAAAHDIGMLTIGLLGYGDVADGGGSVRGGDAPSDVIADHGFVVPSGDASVVKESNVTTYHVLWELVHVFLDAGPVGSPVASEGVESLYPFLYGGTSDEADLLASVATSTLDKVAEITELRAATGRELAAPLARCAREVGAALRSGATVWAFGNGGSSTDAQDVARSFLDPGPGLTAWPALCLTSDAAIITALANDVGYDIVFARQIRAFARRGDIAIGLSTSGGSPNVLAALDEAHEMGLLTIGIAGYGGGAMAQSASIDHLFAVTSASVHRVQEVQTTIYHVLAELSRQAAATSSEPPSA
jgi:D-sedoheptulose 7-phosphate isomerase